MAKYLLDSNIITALEDPDKPGFMLVTERLLVLAEHDEVCISILAAYEYKHGIAKASEELKESLQKSWDDFEERFAIVPLSLDGAELYGTLKAEYEKHTGASKRALMERTVDLILASTAIEHEAVLVSDDRIFHTIREFTPSLQVENWKEPANPSGRDQ